MAQSPSIQSKKMDCEPPFWRDISVLIDQFALTYTPSCSHSMWNYVARIAMISLFIGMMLSPVFGFQMIFLVLLFGILIALMVIYLTPTITKKKESDSEPSQKEIKPPVTGYLTPLSISEHFVNGGSKEGSVQPIESDSSIQGVEEYDGYPYSGPALPDYTPPTSRNPFMNVLLDEYKYNPQRPEAVSVEHPDVKQTMDDYFRIQWFSDPTDVFGKNQGQRQFITQPSTTVPNDQGSFANWLYKIPGKTCKEGGREACLAGTDGGALPWLNQSS